MKTKLLLAPGILVIAALLAFTGVAHASSEHEHHRSHKQHNEHNIPSPESPPSPPSEAEPAPPVQPVERDGDKVPPTEPQPVGNGSSENVPYSPVEASTPAAVRLK